VEDIQYSPAPIKPNPAPWRKAPRQSQRVYVGIPEAAAYLDIAPRTVRELIAEGKLAGYRLNDRVIKVKLADLDAVFTPVPHGGAA
jgi:excisionase family DNA binding protein